MLALSEAWFVPTVYVIAVLAIVGWIRSTLWSRHYQQCLSEYYDDLTGCSNASRYLIMEVVPVAPETVIDGFESLVKECQRFQRVERNFLNEDGRGAVSQEVRNLYDAASVKVRNKKVELLRRLSGYVTRPEFDPDRMPRPWYRD